MKTVTLHAPHLSVKRTLPQPVPVVPAVVTSPVPPNALELAGHFAGAMTRWALAGFPTLNEGQYKVRRGICEACPLFDATAHRGIGKCKKCGCTAKKLWLTTEACPDGKW